MAKLSWFNVRFKTVCASCREDVLEGDYAAYSKEEPGQILCLECGRSEEEAR